MKRWVVVLLALSALTEAIYADWWESEDSLRASKDYFDRVTHEQFEDFSSVQLVEVYVYHSVHYLDLSATAWNVLTELANRSDLSTKDILSVMASIPTVGHADSPYLSESSVWALSGLMDLTEHVGLLDGSQEPGASELAIGFTIRAMEYTVRSDAAENFLLTSTIGMLHRGGWLSFDAPDKRNTTRPFVQSFLDHFGVTAAMRRPGGVR